MEIAKKTRVITLGSYVILAAFLLSACTNTDLAQNTQDNVVATTSHASDEMMEDEMMELPGELSAEEASKYKFGLLLNERVKLAEDLAMQMPRNGMDQMFLMFPDLQKTASFGDDDPRNMMQMGVEAFYYSPEANITISVCSEANSPIHVYAGNNPSQTEIDEAIDMMHKMMPMDPVDRGYLEEAPLYTDFSEDLYSELLGHEPFVLFFHADWCPVCVSLEKDIKAELSKFPNGTKIIKANFDKEDALKIKYNIVVQSTFIVVDAHGNTVKTLAAPANDDLIDAIKDTL